MRELSDLFKFYLEIILCVLNPRKFVTKTAEGELFTTLAL